MELVMNVLAGKDIDLDFSSHSYYTLPIPLRKSIEWKDFYEDFKANGGDGFYAEPLPPYKEPALMDDDVSCPIAEDVQKHLMLFKTNYRDLGKAEQQADILRKIMHGN